MNNPEKSARAFRNGRFYPRDPGTLNEQGYLFIKGRIDDVINKFGSKFYPAEVEDVPLRHPDIKEEAVFGVPHKYSGQVAAACFTAKRPVGKKTLAVFCQQHLSGYKIPHYYAELKNLPENPMGKILKNRLRDQLVKATNTK